MWTPAESDGRHADQAVARHQARELPLGQAVGAHRAPRQQCRDSALASQTVIWTSAATS